ncbi:type III secretion HpaP family protein [Alcaligenes sp. Marseille-Q7550]
MAESRIDLNIGLGPGSFDLPGEGNPQARREASDADRQAFEQALAEPVADTDAPPELPKPFAFFSDAARSDDANTDEPHDLEEPLSESEDRLLASDGGSARREVRSDLKAEVRPQVQRSVDDESDGFDQAPPGPGLAAAAPADQPKSFALYPDSVRPADAGADTSQSLARLLSVAADRLLVGDGSSGRREVRIELKADVLPGVSVSVYEEAAYLVVEFTCSRESSRDTLCRCAQQLADELAGSLRRSTAVRVHTDDPDDLCPFEAAGAAG